MGPNFGPFGLMQIFFPLFGVAFTVGGIALGLHHYAKAQKYLAAYQAYQARRNRAQQGS
jgi:hypothetical protein